MMQEEIDRLTFDHFVDLARPDLGVTKTETARDVAHQMGCSPSTVLRRVRRHALALHRGRVEFSARIEEAGQAGRGGGRLR